MSDNGTTEVAGRSQNARPALPPEQPLGMPQQSLKDWSTLNERKSARPFMTWRTAIARLVVFGGAAALTAYGANEMYGVVSVSRTTFLQYVLLGLFIITFSWIALAFTSAIVGFVSLLVSKNFFDDVASNEYPLNSRNALVMPVYNEDTSRCFAALQAIRESVEQTGQGKKFDYFILSDTTNPDVWVAEERAFLAMRDRLGADAPIYYRHRSKNIGRKAGNIADFVTRWGSTYDHFIVLDADSLMTGECIVTLARAMERDPDAGIIQSLPLIINRNTLFARLQQFAARVYGPVIAAGLSAWMGRDGNYWGHNAIIRTRAFAEQGGMPTLPGKPPFGGHILSHDFVEAALLRRAGWAVYMVPTLAGSYEESPPSLIDLSVRDRRWCQGNLQHIGVIGAKGLKWATRQHFATGIMSYAASPLWLMQLVVGLILVLQTKYVRPEYFTEEFSLFPAWPRFDPERALQLFMLTIGILIAPKIFGVMLVIFRRSTCRDCGGTVRLLISATVEIIASALIAPVAMLIQSGAVFQILAGRDTGWNPQRRGDGSIPFADIVRRHRLHTLLGLIAGAAAYALSPYLFAWMSPTIIGLVLAIPISAASGNLMIGLALKRVGLLLTPEERKPPQVAVRANALQKELQRFGFDESDSLAAIHTDARLRDAHIAMLPECERRQRGQIDPSRAIAEAKLTDARSIDEATRWLQGRERMIVLSDRALIAVLASLADTPVSTTGEAGQAA